MKRLLHLLTLYHLREDIALCDASCGYSFAAWAGARGWRCPLRVWGELRRTREMLKQLPYGRL